MSDNPTNPTKPIVKRNTKRTKQPAKNKSVEIYIPAMIIPSKRKVVYREPNEKGIVGVNKKNLLKKNTYKANHPSPTSQQLADLARDEVYVRDGNSLIKTAIYGQRPIPKPRPRPKPKQKQ